MWEGSLFPLSLCVVKPLRRTTAAAAGVWPGAASQWRPRTCRRSGWRHAAQALAPTHMVPPPRPRLRRAAAPAGPHSERCSLHIFPDSGLNWNPLPRRRPKQQATSPPGSGGGAMFGPGISWEADAPNAHTIGRVLDLIDENGMDVSGSVVSGSLLTHVDEMEVANFSQQTVDKMLAGARNSTVTVCIFNPKTQSEMTLELRRHAPEVVGRASPIAVVRSAPTSPPVAPLTPTEPIPQSVTEFEAAGNTLTPPGQAPESVAGVPLSELMKARAADDRGTLGVRIAMSMEETDLAPTQIQTVVPGSVAYAAGALQEGDDIVAIDGVPVSEHDIIPVIIGSNVIGSPCCLTVNRKGREFDVQLIRYSVPRREHRHRSASRFLLHSLCTLVFVAPLHLKAIRRNRSSALRLQETDDVLVMLDDLAMSIDRYEGPFNFQAPPKCFVN